MKLIFALILSLSAYSGDERTREGHTDLPEVQGLVVSLIDQQGFRVYIMDLPGIGKSDRPRRTYDLESLDDAVGPMLQYIVRKPAHVVCRDITCLSVLKYGANRPREIKSVSVIDPVEAFILSQS